MKWQNRACVRNALVLMMLAALCLPLAARGRIYATLPDLSLAAPSFPESSFLELASNHRISAEHSGTVPVAGTHKLSLTADTGSVHVFTDSTAEVRYLIRVEAESADPDANKLLKEYSVSAQRTAGGVEISGRMLNRDAIDHVWISYEVHIPRRYDLEISTQAGDIETQDIDGHVALSTGGGTIHAGRIGAPAAEHARSAAPDAIVARLETGGGHIFVGDVAGTLHASTAGGHIVAKNVDGNAVLHTDGGHIQVGHIAGIAQLFTGGGNIVAQGADRGVQADSAGGRIELGEASGAIHARSGGGGIRIARLSGPIDLDSREGAIFLAGVAVPLRAATAAGTITAWFSPTFGSAVPGPVSAAGAPAAAQTTPSVPGGVLGGVHTFTNKGSELFSQHGDIIVYLPGQLPLTVDAELDQSAGHRIVADPSLPISLPIRAKHEESPEGQIEHEEIALNGGGQVLHLRAIGGDIELRVLDQATLTRFAKQQAEAEARNSDMQQALLSSGQGATSETVGDSVISMAPGSRHDQEPSSSLDAFSVWTRWFSEFWWGGLRVAPEEQQKRLIQSAAPAYPDVAQQAGIEGDVTLRVVVGPNGKVNDVRLIAGDPVLARAAADAVERWRYAPALLEGRPVSVVTTVTLAFRLR